MRLKFVFVFIMASCVLSYSQIKDSTKLISAESAVKYYNSILNRSGGNKAYAYHGLASLSFMTGNFKLAIEQSKNNIGYKNEYQAESFIIYAASIDRTGFPEDAIKEFEKALKLYPDNYQLHYQYALSCYKFRELTKAHDALKKTIELQPLFAEAHYLNGCVLFENSNNKECVASFLYALMVDNDSARSCQALAFVNEYLNHNPESIKIPFYDRRYSVASVDNILGFYFPKITKNRILADIKYEYFAGQIEQYVMTESLSTPLYSQLFIQLAEKNLAKAFSHYVLRTTGSKYITEWYKVNGQPLKALADFLEKNLPGSK